MTDKPRLLAVDDEPDILDFLERVFRRHYVVLRAGDADQATAVLADTPPAVLVSDQRMPGRTGLELLEEVSKSHPEITRCLLSGFSDLPEITAAAESGLVHAYVVKPVDSKRLREAVEEARARHEQVDWKK
jgi:Response regulator containing CheY-like receiver, AAA-type ATPase, and DNA-binding domains